MKLKSNKLREIIPVSSHTINRYVKSGDFPAPERIGREYWHDEPAIYEWLNARTVEPSGVGDACDYKVKGGDKLIDTNTVSKLLGRSSTWIWSNITKDTRFTKIDLSPSGGSANPRNYFIEREIKEAFPQLININNNNEVSGNDTKH